MCDIINLKQARKQRDRDAKHKVSAVKRVQFGQSKNDKNVVEILSKNFVKKLDDHKLDPSKPTDD